MNEISLLGKKVLIDKSPVLFDYSPDKDWEKYWRVGTGMWKEENGYLIGSERGNFGGILLSREYYEKDVMISFDVATVLPATRDLNAVYCARWDEEKNYLAESYVCGLNGWYDNKSGIERNFYKESNLYSTTSLYKYTPGTTVRITGGAINGHNFMVVDDELVTELVDPNPIRGGYVGFSAYCTTLKINNIQIREIYWEEQKQLYIPEF